MNKGKAVEYIIRLSGGGREISTTQIYTLQLGSSLSMFKVMCP